MGIHHEYLQAGAEIIETNTFGANRFAWPHSLADKVREINLAALAWLAKPPKASMSGWQDRLARWVFRIEPLGKTSFEEARAAFREQIDALIEAGVDLLILETFGNLEELHEAILAAREVEPKSRGRAGDDRRSRQLPGRHRHRRPSRQAGGLGRGRDRLQLQRRPGGDARRHRARARGHHPPLAAQPNAGMPRASKDATSICARRNTWRSYARKFCAAGVRLVGGCCGTTPEHIRVMKSALRVGEARAEGSRAGHQCNSRRAAALTPAVPLENARSSARSLPHGEFVTMVEIVPPKGIDARKEIEGARLLKSVGIDAINVPDGPRACARMSNQALSHADPAARRDRGDPALHLPRPQCARHPIATCSGAAAVGLRNLLCITGDPPKMGNYPDATAVFDVDAIGLVNIVHNLNHGLDIGGNPIGAGTGFVIGVGANPGVAESRRRDPPL